MADKIIHTLQQRRQLEQEFTALAQTESEEELIQQAQQISRAYDADSILATMLRHLDTGSGQLRGGLGWLATLLPSEQVSTTLRKAVGDRRNSPQSRFTASMILQRFLDEEVPPSLLGDLPDPEQVVMQSLQEAISAGEQNRYVLLEYVRQMRQESEHVAGLVLKLVERLPAAQQLDLLRLVAQDDRPQVARGALQRLAAIRTVPAARVLHTLVPNLPPELATVAEESIRKLRFAGVHYTAPGADGWRCLVSPASPSGTQTTWFVGMDTATAGNVVIGVYGSPLGGLAEAFGLPNVERGRLPEFKEIGTLVSVDMSHAAPFVLLEVPFDYGRQWLLELLAIHWQPNPPRAVADEYKLYNDMLWQFSPPQIDEALQLYRTADEALWTRAQQEMDLDQLVTSLWQHPAMGGWFFHSEALLRFVQAQGTGVEPEALVQMVPAFLEVTFRDAGGERVLTGLEKGLRAQAGWLHLAGSRQQAHCAQILAESIQRLEPLHNPVLIHMMALGMQQAVVQLHRTS